MICAWEVEAFELSPFWQCEVTSNYGMDYSSPPDASLRPVNINTIHLMFRQLQEAGTGADPNSSLILPFLIFLLQFMKL